MIIAKRDWQHPAALRGDTCSYLPLIGREVIRPSLIRKVAAARHSSINQDSNKDQITAVVHPKMAQPNVFDSKKLFKTFHSFCDVAPLIGSTTSHLTVC